MIKKGGDRGNTALVVNAEQPQTYWFSFYQNELSNPDIYYIDIKRKYKMPFVRARKECSLVVVKGLKRVYNYI